MILKISPKFQVLDSHFSEVNDLLDEHWAKKTLSYVELECNQCQNMHRSIVCCQECGVTCLASQQPLYQTWAILTWKSTSSMRKIPVCEIWWAIYHFLFRRSIQTYGLVVKASCCEQGDMESSPWIESRRVQKVSAAPRKIWLPLFWSSRLRVRPWAWACRAHMCGPGLLTAQNRFWIA